MQIKRTLDGTRISSFETSARREYVAGVMAALIKCPICRRESDFFAEPLGPFCSVRCKMVDLGQWLGEEYRISEPLRPDHLAAYEEMQGDALDRLDEEENPR